MIDVTIIARQGTAALVQWIDGAGDVHRSTVPLDALKFNPTNADEARCKAPEMGIPYGVAWSEILNLSNLTDRLEQEFYKRGIWTGADALRLSPAVEGALKTALGADLNTILATAMQIDREERSNQ
jgi:hypothetical protein